MGLALLTSSQLPIIEGKGGMLPSAIDVGNNGPVNSTNGLKACGYSSPNAVFTKIRDPRNMSS